MRTKLGIVTIIIEIASIVSLLFLPRLDGLPDKYGVILAFLLPITFGLHVFEEFVFPGGMEDWMKSYRPQLAGAVTQSYLFKINAIPLVASLLVSLGVFNYLGSYSFGGLYAWLVLMSIQAFNALFHIRAAIKTKQYAPGLVSSIVFYLPLAIVSFVFFIKIGAINIFSAIGCLIIGSFFQSILDFFKERKLKKKEQNYSK
jgi:hypothetical protein